MCKYTGISLDPGVALVMPRALQYHSDKCVLGGQKGVTVPSVSLCPYAWLQLIHAGRRNTLKEIKGR